MIKSRMRKILGDVRSRKGRTALVALSIMIGVFGVAVMVSINALITSQLREDLKADEIAMMRAYVVMPFGRTSLEQNLETIEELSQQPGVTNVEGQSAYPVSWQVVGADDAERFNDSVILSNTSGWENAEIEPIARVINGRLPVAGSNEIAVERRFADKYGVGLGDSLVFRQIGATGEPEEWEIVGIVLQPYFAVAPTTQALVVPAEESIFAEFEDAQQIANSPGVSAFLFRYTDFETAQASQEDLSGFITAETPYIAGFMFPDNPDEAFIIQQVSQVTVALNALAVVAMVVSAFLVTNVINTIVIEQKRQIGVMKSMGASRWDNFFMYGGMAFVYGVIGTIVGVLLAMPVASAMAVSLAPFAFTYLEPGFYVSVTGVVIAVIMGLIVPIIAAALPVYNGTRVSVLDAMTDLGISSDWGRTRFSRFVGRLPLPINARQALSNIVQKKWRLTLTVMTLSLAIGAFMGVTALFSSLSGTISSIFDSFDYEIQMITLTSEDIDTIRPLVMDNVEGVENVYPGASATIGIEGYESEDALNPGSNQINAVGFDPASSPFAFDLESGDAWNIDPTRRGVVITRSLAASLEKSAGDTLVVIGAGEQYEYEIIGVDSLPFPLIYFDWRELATISDYVNEAGDPLLNTFFINLAGDVEAPDVDEVIIQVEELMLANGIQATYGNQPQTAEEQAQQINAFGLIFNMTSAVMAAVGAIGLLATLSMAVFERQKEIGVMRSIGASSFTITTQFLVEGILVGIIAWVIGVPLSFLLASSLSVALDFADFFTYPPVMLLQGFLGIVVIATLASIWPSLSAARKTVSEILRYQ